MYIEQDFMLWKDHYVVLVKKKYNYDEYDSMLYKNWKKVGNYVNLIFWERGNYQFGYWFRENELITFVDWEEYFSLSTKRDFTWDLDWILIDYKKSKNGDIFLVFNHEWTFKLYKNKKFINNYVEHFFMRVYDNWKYIFIAENPSQFKNFSRDIVYDVNGEFTFTSPNIKDVSFDKLWKEIYYIFKDKEGYLVYKNHKIVYQTENNLSNIYVDEDVYVIEIYWRKSKKIKI